MLGLILMIVSAVAYYRIAQADNRSGVLWAALAIVCWYGGAVVYGFAGALIGQLLPFVLMTASNMMKK